MFKIETFLFGALAWLMGWGMTVKLGITEPYGFVFFIIAGSLAVFFGILLKILWTLLCMGAVPEDECRR